MTTKIGLQNTQRSTKFGKPMRTSGDYDEVNHRECIVKALREFEKKMFTFMQNQGRCYKHAY